MSLETQISLITNPQEFARLCNALLRAEHGDDFLAIDDDQPDAGNDGYLKSQRRMYAMHCFKRAQNQRIEQLIRRKMVGDLGKAIALRHAGVWQIDAWTFVSNYPVSERVAAELVSLGDRAGIEVSWMGPSQLAAEIQAHPHVRDLFPALQVNEVSDRLGELRRSVEGLARGLDQDAGELPNVPRTPEEQARLIAARPACWEYRLFAGAVIQGQDALEFAYLDYVMRVSRASEETDFHATMDTIRALLHRVEVGVGQLSGAFTAEVQERAFGPPGEPGDVAAILHLAGRITTAYADLLEAGRQLLSIEPPQLLMQLRELVLRYLGRPIEQIRAFVASLLEALSRLDDHIASSEPVVIDLVLAMELDPEVEQALHAELRRVRRTVRRRRWTGRDLDRR